MGLSWDVTAVENHEEIQTDAEWPITHALIWSAIGVDLREITKDNIDEWMVRLAVTSRLYGAPMQSASGPVEFTREMVERRIGLKCNVTPTTRAAFIRKVGKSMVEEAQRAIRV